MPSSVKIGPRSRLAGWPKLTPPDEDCMHVSHETIYKSLFVQTRGLLRKELRNHLREASANSVMRRVTSPGQDSRSSMAYPFGKGLLRSKTVQFRGIGKVILSAVQKTATLPLLLNGRPALRFWLKSRAKRQTVWSQPWRVKWLNCWSG
jgi:hypothetical protein